MNNHFQAVILRATGASGLTKIETIQSLWSGYGDIVRYRLTGGDRDRVVVKHVKLPERAHHPRGWNSDLSHQRKVRSYHVESAWYRDYGRRCDERCRIPLCLALEEGDEEFLMVLEDLDASGFPLRKASVTMGEMAACLRWLANFHATFMGREPVGLWEVGSYWHLDTRPDELAVLNDPALRRAAGALDRLLRESDFQTLIHGDAKLANFCFSRDGRQVAAVDFQYVGGGCGMKDVAYFIGSCLREAECERHEGELLALYFAELTAALARHGVAVDPAAVERAWRPLYPVAWTDFHRFMKGWSPGHWKVHGYSERIAREVVAQLNLPPG